MNSRFSKRSIPTAARRSASVGGLVNGTRIMISEVDKLFIGSSLHYTVLSAGNHKKKIAEFVRALCHNNEEEPVTDEPVISETAFL